MTAAPSWTAILASPLGPLGLATGPEGLAAVAFLPPETAPLEPRSRLAEDAAQALMAYFDDPSRPFRLPLSPSGSAFQLRAWAALQTIPSGETRTYGEFARLLATSARAVGGACRRNPIAIVIPCHRIVASTGLGGYGGALGGASLEAKRWLLEHEGVHR